MIDWTSVAIVVIFGVPSVIGLVYLGVLARRRRYEFLHVPRCNIDEHGTKYWEVRGGTLLHRGDDLPAVEYENCRRVWFRYNLLHRDHDRPAVINENCDQEWYMNDMRTRGNDKPAIVCNNGHRQWWINNERHREYGPAVIFADGRVQFFLFDLRLTERMHRRMVDLPRRWRRRRLWRSLAMSRRFRRCLLAMPTGHISKHFPGGLDFLDTFRDFTFQRPCLPPPPKYLPVSPA